MESEESSVLLRRYTEEGCEESFRTLMHRYVDLIYSAARRRLEGDGAAAEDVVQRVFSELAAQAKSLKADSRLGGWLYRCAVRFAADVHKAALRRRNREQKAAALAPLTTSGPDAWEEVAPCIDEAMQRLPAADRDALVLRFFEDRPLRAVGDALGLTEDAAQKRVSRALSRLRGLLQKRGVAATAAGLASVLASHSVEAAPAGLVAAFSPPAATSTAGSFFTLHSLMNTKSILTAAAVVAVVAVPVFLVLRPDEDSGKQGRGPAIMENPDAGHRNRLPDVAAKPSVDVTTASQPEEKKEASAGGKETAPLSLAEREAKTRKRAEEITLQRYTEKMDRLTSKLGLTQEQVDKIAAHHQAQRTKWVEYMTGAAFEKADAQYYQLENGYREDIPPALQPLLSEEQFSLYREHDKNKRTNHIEAVTSGEINYLAQRLDLDPAKKDALFQTLAGINGTDLFSDLGGITDLAGIAKQADHDLERRRTAFAALLDEQQMKVWEAVATGYKKELLHRFGQRTKATVEASGEKGGTSSSS